LIIRTKSGSTEYPGVFNFKEKKIDLILT
jgi:hypothetical protein